VSQSVCNKGNTLIIHRLNYDFLPTWSKDAIVQYTSYKLFCLNPYKVRLMFTFTTLLLHFIHIKVNSNQSCMNGLLIYWHYIHSHEIGIPVVTHLQWLLLHRKHATLRFINQWHIEQYLFIMLNHKYVSPTLKALRVCILFATATFTIG